MLATTNRDLRKAVATGEFREDLYYRLNVFPVHVPALRDRQEDIPVLAAHFLERFSRRHGMHIPGFTEAASESLCEHAWPGNVRELQNTIERAVILTDDGAPVRADALGLATSGERDFSARIGIPANIGTRIRDDSATVKTLSEVEREHILHALEQNGGNRTRTAEVLEISIRTLRNKLNEYRVGKEALPN